MKKVTLKSLTLTNFRGEKSRTTEFNPFDTSISGGNGLGKTRHFDAFCWLLFGKDSHDRKDYEIRTCVNGEPLHRVECSVTGTLDISGETVIL
ncbi:MAG: AAA family ATPase [Tannerella sp.]|jgi:recombinational DNA repair ATPase RecF|nr:AAA family ATPase [Tannerella sp.]